MYSTVVVQEFCRGDESLEGEECSSQPWKVTATNWEDHRSWSSSSYTRVCQRSQCQLVYGRSAFEANWKGEKAWQVGAPGADCKSKTWSFWSVIFSYSTQQQTISWLDCDIWRNVDFIQQPAMTSSAVGPRRSSRALSKAKLASKKVMTFWWSAAGLIHYSFLNPGKTITSEKYAQRINEMH